MNNQPEIEPGLLPLFRMLTAVRLGITALAALGFRARNGTWLPVLLSSTDGLFLLAYLSWPAFQRRLGRAYLPIGLGIAAVGPVLVQHAQALFVETWRAALSLTAWQLLPVLLIPVVLAAWQYGFRASLVVIVGAMVLDLGLAPFSIALNQSIPPFAASFEFESDRGFLVALGGRFITLLVAGYAVSRLVLAQRKQSIALAEANKRLVNYASTLEHLATSRERNRLARELHDTLAHSLSAMAVQLEATDALWDATPDEAHKWLAQSLETTRNGLAETRRALQALRAAPLDDLGLGLAVQTLAESTAARCRLRLDVRAPEMVEGLTEEAEQCIYRVAQEALDNISQHADARHITVHLDVQGKRAALLVADDGLGFDVAVALADGHFGLRGMRERAELVGGALDIVSTPGRGTTVRLTIGE